MKVTVEKSALLKSLGHVHRVVERRNTIPILANVLVRAEKSALSLKATDLDLEVIERREMLRDGRLLEVVGRPLPLGALEHLAVADVVVRARGAAAAH